MRNFDEETRAGDVLLDDGSVLAFDAAAFDPDRKLIFSSNGEDGT